MNDKKILNLAYFWAEKFCDKLDIPIPPIEVRGEDYRDWRVIADTIYEVEEQLDAGFFHTDWVIVNEKIVLRRATVGTSYVILRCIAHECRHAWQIRNEDSFSEEDAQEWTKEQIKGVKICQLKKQVNQI